jgi:hypothetical protein
MLPINNRNRTVHFFQICNQIFNRADHESISPAEFQTSIPSHHTNVPAQLGIAFARLATLDQFCDDAHRRFPSQTTEIDRSLGMASPLVDPAGSRTEREDVSRFSEIAGMDMGSGQLPAGQGTVVGGYPRRDRGVVRVDGDGVSGAVGVGILDNHLG